MTTSKTLSEKARVLGANLIIWLAGQEGSTLVKQIALQRVLGIYDEGIHERNNTGKTLVDGETSESQLK